jgi:hypothetical protein
MIFGNEMIVGARLSFFVARMHETHWFFEIYIQGSKYNFLELSLNLNEAVAVVYDCRCSGEFQLSSLSVELETIWRSTD